MSLELRQQVKLAQKLVMTQQLQQAIRLLQMNRIELANAVQAEMERNPMLEEEVNTMAEHANPDALSAEEVKETPEAAVMAAVAGDDPATVARIDWEEYSNNFDTDISFARETPSADAPSRLDFISVSPGLISFLEWQLTHLSLSETDLDIARFILGCLDGHGFFQGEITDICTYVKCSEEEAKGMLRLIQSLDPSGVAARNIQESLLLQLDRRGMAESLAYRIAAEFLDELQGRKFSVIARKTKYTVRETEQAAKMISTLTPYPGNEYNNEQIHYVTPDIYLYKIDGEFVIQLNTEDIPQIRVSDAYQDILDGQAESRGYLQEKKRNAERFINSFHYRQKTIYKVMKSLLKFQYDFFEKGPSHLKPLVLGDVAQDIGMHESSVSRVTSNKYVHTPQGIYELKYFFSTAVAMTNDGSSMTAESIKSRIRQFIRAEDPTKPLSDSKISALLAEEGIKVARRTVAKYRDQMKILPVKHRREKG